MAGFDPSLPIKSGSPESFGWQRRPDKDTESGWSYENPDGELKLFPKGQTPEIRSFDWNEFRRLHLQGKL